MKCAGAIVLLLLLLSVGGKVHNEAQSVAKLMPALTGALPARTHSSGVVVLEALFEYSPSDASTDSPTTTATNSPTVVPTDSPTATRTDTPTATPTDVPTAAPTTQTESPTNEFTPAPTIAPSSASPTIVPTLSPTDHPTVEVTPTPTIAPTSAPTNLPTITPSLLPTVSPTIGPTPSPTISSGPTFDFKFYVSSSSFHLTWEITKLGMTKLTIESYSLSLEGIAAYVLNSSTTDFIYSNALAATQYNATVNATFSDGSVELIGTLQFKTWANPITNTDKSMWALIGPSRCEIHFDMSKFPEMSNYSYVALLQTDELIVQRSQGIILYTFTDGKSDHTAAVFTKADSGDLMFFKALWIPEYSPLTLSLTTNSPAIVSDAANSSNSRNRIIAFVSGASACSFFFIVGLVLYKARTKKQKYPIFTEEEEEPLNLQGDHSRSEHENGNKLAF